MLNFLKKFLALFNTIEGVLHLITAAISFWGIFSGQIYDWKVWASPVENLLLGAFSLFTGYILGIDHHGHSIKKNKEEHSHKCTCHEDCK